MYFVLTEVSYLFMQKCQSLVRGLLLCACAKWGMVVYFRYTVYVGYQAPYFAKEGTEVLQHRTRTAKTIIDLSTQ